MLFFQEAERCIQALRQSQYSVVDDETAIRIFTKLMLHGKEKATICWAMERKRGVVYYFQIYLTIVLPT